MSPAPLLYGLLAVYALNYVGTFLTRAIPTWWKHGWHADLVLIDALGSLVLALLSTAMFAATAIIFLWVVGKTTP